jgi:S1-C subfamily serine protease
LTFAKGEDSISPETVATIKRATVFIKVPLGDRLATGSGWAMKVEEETVYLVANHYVIADAPKVGREAPPIVTVVFHSGSKQEQSAQAVVLASQRQPDLAVLRVSGIKEPSPPIDSQRSPEIVETMPVIVFGFPFTGLDRDKSPPSRSPEGRCPASEAMRSFSWIPI